MIERGNCPWCHRDVEKIKVPARARAVHKKVMYSIFEIHRATIGASYGAIGTASANCVTVPLGNRRGEQITFGPFKQNEWLTIEYTQGGFELDMPCRRPVSDWQKFCDFMRC